MRELIKNLDWNRINEEMNRNGFAVISKLIGNRQCDEIAKLYERSDLYRKTVVMERHRFGKGEYKYFNYPLPDPLQSIRESIYPHLSRIANTWMKALKLDQEYPSNLDELHEMCRAKEQTKPTVLILRYEEGGFDTLHQDLYGEVWFPIQLVLFLTDPGDDYLGGEFVITEQVPRAQSKAIVLSPSKGDALLLSTNFRPVKGSRGYYRANMRHGVSEVKSGNRMTVGVIFHDALT